MALSLCDARIHPDGFTVVRIGDITKTSIPAPYAQFVRQALRLRREKLGGAPWLDLSSWRSIIGGTSKRYALVTLHIEKKKPDVCYIGRPIRLTSMAGTFLTIDPGAEWDYDDPLTFAWADVTRIDFGGEYEKALVLVAQPMPMQPTAPTKHR